MKYTLTSAKQVYYEKSVEDMDQKKELDKFGFTWEYDEKYKSFIIRPPNPIIEFTTIEELNNFIKEFGSIIISETYDDNNDLLEITIYNDYVE